MTDSEQVSDIVPHAARGAPRNLQIQWLRALAAIMVVLFHGSVYGVAVLKDDSFMKVLDGHYGLAGVSLFFAISGYLMATAIRVQDPFVFLSHRIIRIYPAFFLATALYCVVEYALDQPSRLDLRNLTLAPVGVTANYPLRVEWTLVFELTFYISLFLVGLFRGARFLPWLALAWLAMLAEFSWHRPDSGDLMYPLQRILTVCENAGMAGGLLIPTLLRLRIPPVLLLVAGIAAWPLYTLYPVANDQARWLFGMGATLVVAGAVGLSARWPQLGQNRIGRKLAEFGDYSYALYLIHVPIIYSIYSSVHGLSYPTLWTIALAASLLAAVALGKLDVFLYRRLKSSLKRVPMTRLRWAIGVYIALMLAVSIPASWKTHIVDDRRDAARGLAALIAAQGPIATAAEANAAAVAAGFHPSAALQGELEKAATNKYGFEITGWAVDTDVAAGSPTGATLVAVFQDGHLLQAGPTSFARGDIRRRFGTKAKTGFAFTLKIACVPDKPIVGLALSPDHGFAVLPNTPLPDCTER